MQRDALPTSEEGNSLSSRPLFSAQLLKAVNPAANSPWKLAGIASDETADLEGDKILRKTIDLSYAQHRGYVNWDHSRQPEDQIGYLTQAEIIPTERVKELKKNFPAIRDSASIYVEGELYKGIPRAQHVYEILKSLPDGGTGGLGLSLDGSLARDLKSGGIVKAYVRGVAVTAQPMHPNTLVQLRKSLAFYNEGDGTWTPEFLERALREVKDDLAALRKAIEGSGQLNHDQAVLFVLKQRPHWSFTLAKRIVAHAMKINGSKT